MGLFSRKDKAPKAVKMSLSHQPSNGSLASGASSLRSPDVTSYSSRNVMNRTSGGTVSTGPGTPLTPFSPHHSMPVVPKIDMPKPPDPQLDPAGYLRSLPSIRERAQVVTNKAYRNELLHFDVDMQKFGDVVTFVANIIKVGRRTNGAFWFGVLTACIAERL